MLPVDASGKPLMNGVLYGVDTRATAQIAALNAAIGEDGGARMTGGGFGGCVVAVVAADRLPAVDRALADHWLGTGRPAQAHFLGIPSAGACLLQG